LYYGEEKSHIHAYFDSQSRSSHNENKGVETSVPKYCGIFFRIFRDFSRIFDKPKILTKALVPPCTPASCTTVETGLEMKYRDPITAIHGIKYRYPTTRSKLACSTPAKKSKNCQITVTLQTPNACYNLQFFYAR